MYNKYLSRVLHKHYNTNNNKFPLKGVTKGNAKNYSILRITGIVVFKILVFCLDWVYFIFIVFR